jgi:isopentenyldiphosphate isomerase
VPTHPITGASAPSQTVAETADEMLDLVDDEDRVIGRALRSEIYDRGLRNFRVINLFLMNSIGRLWIPRRHGAKSLFPFALDVGVGGHVISGESYEQALAREMAEEIGVDLRSVQVEFLGYLTPSRDGVSAFTKTYLLRTDATPALNSEEFMEARWRAPNEVLRDIASGERAKDDLPLLLRRFFVGSRK